MTRGFSYFAVDIVRDAPTVESLWKDFVEALTAKKAATPSAQIALPSFEPKNFHFGNLHVTCCVFKKTPQKALEDVEDFIAHSLVDYFMRIQSPADTAFPYLTSTQYITEPRMGKTFKTSKGGEFSWTRDCELYFGYQLCDVVAAESNSSNNNNCPNNFGFTATHVVFWDNGLAAVAVKPKDFLPLTLDVEPPAPAGNSGNCCDGECAPASCCNGNGQNHGHNHKSHAQLASIILPSNSAKSNDDVLLPKMPLTLGKYCHVTVANDERVHALQSNYLLAAADACLRLAFKDGPTPSLGPKEEDFISYKQCIPPQPTDEKQVYVFKDIMYNCEYPLDGTISVWCIGNDKFPVKGQFKHYPK